EPEGRADERRARLAKHPYLMRQNRAKELAEHAKELQVKGEYSQALSAVGQALQIEPQNRELLIQQGQLRRMYETSRSKGEYEKALQLEKEGKLEGAVSQLKIVAGLDIKNADAAHRLAALLLRTGGDLKEAKGYAQRAVELQPQEGKHRVLLGKV